MWMRFEKTFFRSYQDVFDNNFGFCPRLKWKAFFRKTLFFVAVKKRPEEVFLELTKKALDKKS